MLLEANIFASCALYKTPMHISFGLAHTGMCPANARRVSSNYVNITRLYGVLCLVLIPRTLYPQLMLLVVMKHHHDLQSHPS
jgi:hypothetical protein